MAVETATTTEAPAGLSALDALELAETGELPEGAAAPAETSAAGEEPSGESTEGGEEQPENQAAEPFWPGKFNTPEDMRTGYENVEKAFTQKAQEAAAYKAQLQQAQQLLSGQQQGAQAGQPEVRPAYLPQYQHPAQGYTPEQFEQLQYEDPIRAADYVAQVRLAEGLGNLVSNIAPFLAEQQERTREQDSKVTIANLRAVFGDEVYQKHEQAVVSAVTEDPSFYNVDAATREARLQQAFLAEMAKEMLATQTKPERPRDAASGQFVSGEQRTTHVEPGSSGQTAGASDANVAPEIRQMRAERDSRDAFGALPPVLRG